MAYLFGRHARHRLTDLISYGHALLAHRMWLHRSFMLGTRQYTCCAHPYNRTWTNERAVEIPWAYSIIDEHRGSRILECGNVLSHYFPVEHDVIDKYERAYGCINEDIVAFFPPYLYDLVVSISTIEHIGWDERPRNVSKAIAALERMKALVRPGGGLFLTVPIGYNPYLDGVLQRSCGEWTEMAFLRKDNRMNGWREVAADEAWTCTYGSPFSCANAVGFFEWRRPIS
jgi:hypothetical protein